MYIKYIIILDIIYVVLDMSTCMLACITLVCCLSCVSPLCHYKELQLFKTQLGLEGQNYVQERTLIADQEAERDAVLRSEKQAKSKALNERVDTKLDVMYKIKSVHKDKKEDAAVWASKAGD